MTQHQKFPDLFLSLPHDCSYLPDRMASSLFIDPNNSRTPEFYPQLLNKGFRRSGRLIYRPHCSDCNACISVRIPVDRFVPRRGQKRVLNRNRDITCSETSPGFNEEHYALYRKYQKLRHAGGSMDLDDQGAYEDFLVNSPVDSRFYEMRAPVNGNDSRLLAVAVTDITDEGLSAVYTFFDPEHPRRALGVFSILRQIELAKQQKLEYLYLGYWIEACRKMSYKRDYRPLQGFISGNWVDLQP